MTCPSCQARASTQHSGLYNFKCLECCVRLVQSARLDRHQAGNMLASIALHRDAPSRKEILEALKESKDEAM